MKGGIFNRLTMFLSELEQKGISYTLAHHRDEAIMVLVAMPGERWEIEFLGDGSVEIEKFTSSGELYGEEVLSELFARYTDQEASAESSESAEVATLEGKIA
jgi:hypothetical protein